MKRLSKLGPEFFFDLRNTIDSSDMRISLDMREDYWNIYNYSATRATFFAWHEPNEGTMRCTLADSEPFDNFEHMAMSLQASTSGGSEGCLGNGSKAGAAICSNLSDYQFVLISKCKDGSTCAVKSTLMPGTNSLLIEDVSEEWLERFNAVLGEDYAWWTVGYVKRFSKAKLKDVISRKVVATFRSIVPQSQNVKLEFVRHIISPFETEEWYRNLSTAVKVNGPRFYSEDYTSFSDLFALPELPNISVDNVDCGKIESISLTINAQIVPYLYPGFRRQQSELVILNGSHIGEVRYGAQYSLYNFFMVNQAYRNGVDKDLRLAKMPFFAEKKIPYIAKAWRVPWTEDSVVSSEHKDRKDWPEMPGYDNPDLFYLRKPHAEFFVLITDISLSENGRKIDACDDLLQTHIGGSSALFSSRNPSTANKILQKIFDKAAADGSQEFQIVREAALRVFPKNNRGGFCKFSAIRNAAKNPGKIYFSSNDGGRPLNKCAVGDEGKLVRLHNGAGQPIENRQVESGSIGVKISPVNTNMYYLELAPSFFKFEKESKNRISVSEAEKAMHPEACYPYRDVELLVDGKRYQTNLDVIVPATGRTRDKGGRKLSFGGIVKNEIPHASFGTDSVLFVYTPSTDELAVNEDHAWSVGFQRLDRAAYVETCYQRMKSEAMSEYEAIAKLDDLRFKSGTKFGKDYISPEVHLIDNRLRYVLENHTKFIEELLDANNSSIGELTLPVELQVA